MANASSRLEWFQEARFGMFIHWGPYAVQRNGEWSQNADSIPTADYERVADRFTAERFDADAWVRAARNAGMKYMVLTTKHHDGFCLWDTATTDWNAVKRGPRRDIVAEYVAACRRHGMRIGFYWSWLDWHQPDWAQRLVWSEIDAWRKPFADTAAHQRMVEYLHAQVRELMTRYGPIDVLWFDGGVLSPDDYRSAELVTMIRSHQPDILINDRSGLPGDFGTPEGCMPVATRDRAWELCHCSHTSWGYEGDEPTRFNPPLELLALLCDSAGLGGNLLLNVGPRPDGLFPEPTHRQLETLGRWISLNGEAIYATGAGPFGRQSWGVSTSRGNTVYLHVFRPRTPLVLRGISAPLVRAGMLATGAPMAFRQAGTEIALDVPRESDPLLPQVIRLEFAERPQVRSDSVVHQDPDGPVLLTANAARTEAAGAGVTPALTLSPDALGGRLLNWSRLGDRAAWEFEVDRGGEFAASFEFNNPDRSNSYSRRLVMRVSGQELRASAPQSTWLHQWESYRLAGRFTLGAGRHTLTMEPYMLSAGILMNLRAVRLDPLENED